MESENRAGQDATIVSYNYMRKTGWQPGRGLGKSENGSRFPLGNIQSSDPAISVETTVGILLENDQNEILLCEEDGKPCFTCDKRVHRLYTILSESTFYDNEDEIAGHSLSRLPEVTIKINNQEIRSLLDTGSQITAISNELYELIKSKSGNLPEVPTPAMQIQGAFGSKSEKVNKLSLVTIELGSVQIDTPVIVLRKLPYPMILGHDWLERMKAVITCGPKKILSVEHLGVRTQIKIGSDYDNSDWKHKLNCLVSESNHITQSTGTNKGGISIQQYVQALSKTEYEKQLLLPVLEKNQTVFSDKPGRTKMYEHKIKMADPTPFMKRSYPIPFKHRELVGKKIAELEELGIIKRESTCYCSPMTYVMKKDGRVRLLLDARELNKRMIGDAEAPPITSEILQSFHNVKFISVLDCSDAYFHIPLESSSTKYTGFTFMGKTYTYNVLPQGLKTSVSSFSRAMDIILGAEVRDFCVNYLDDLVVFTSGTLEKHIEHLGKVLDRLHKANMSCNLAKCSFLQTEVKLLGHIVTVDGIKMDPEKIKAIKEFPQPRNVKQLRGFLGLINYFRKFVYRYGEETKPLCHLLQKNVPFEWTPDIQRVFERVKELFLDSIMLIHPDIDKPYYVQTDASAIGIAGCVYQLSEDGDPMIVGFCSKGLSEAEMRWTVSEQELFAIIYSLIKFEAYLRGAKIIIRTDHKSLTFLHAWKLLGARMIRWVHYIERFDYRIEYIKGTENCVADILSRHIPNVELGRGTRVISPQINLFRASNSRLISEQLKIIEQKQREDTDLRKIIDTLSNNDTSTQDNKSQYYKIENGVLFYDRTGTERKVIVIPVAMRDELITNIHEEIGHFGRHKVYALMKKRFYFLHMAREIGRVIRECDICQKAKCELQATVGPSKSVLALEVGEIVFADLYGPLPPGKFGKCHVFVMQDAFSKFIKLYALRRATGRTVVACVKKFHSEVAIKRIVTDNGAQFVSHAWEDGLAKLNITLSHTSIRNPRPNSTERVNRELGRLIRTYCHKSHRSWVDVIPRIEDSYNNVIHSSTNYTPMELIKGISTRLTTDTLVTKLIPESYVSLETMREQAKRNITKAASTREEFYNKNHKLIQFNIGDKVKLRTLPKSDKRQKITKKFSLLFEGPYVVGAIPYANVYTLIKEDGGIRGNYNAIHLSRYYEKQHTSKRA